MRLTVRLEKEGTEEYKKELDMLRKELEWLVFEQEMPDWSFLVGERRKKLGMIARMKNRIRTLDKIIWMAG